MWKKSILTVPLLLVLGGYVGTLPSLAENATPSGMFTQSGANPVTPRVLYEVENGVSLTFAALNTYRTSCKNKILTDNVRRRAGEVVAPQQCRAIIARLQGYTRQIPPLMAQLRKFVRENDQVNAGVVLAQVRGLIGQFQTYAAANGVTP